MPKYKFALEKNRVYFLPSGFFKLTISKAKAMVTVINIKYPKFTNDTLFSCLYNPNNIKIHDYSQLVLKDEFMNLFSKYIIHLQKKEIQQAQKLYETKLQYFKYQSNLE